MPTAKGLESLRYWERLARGKFLSNERRQDQYRILYCWNVVRGLIPNCGITVDSTRESRRGSPRLSPQSQGPGKPSSPSWWRDPGYSTAFPGPWGTWTASLEPQRLTWIPTWKPSLLLPLLLPVHPCHKSVIPDSINTETIFALVVWRVDKSTTKGNTNTRQIGWLVSFLPPSYTESFELL